MNSNVFEKEIVALFDLDGTLIKKESTFYFFLRLCGYWKVLRAGLRRPLLTLLGLLMPSMFATSSKEYFVKTLLTGVNHDTETFLKIARELSTHVDPVVLSQLRWHQLCGHECVLVTASLDCYVKPISEIFGFDRYISTRLNVREGVLTGEIVGANNRGETKAENILNIYGRKDKYFFFAYGNSKNDLPMLKTANCGLMVKALKRQAKILY